MQPKQQRYTPSKVESKARRAASHQRHQKVDHVKDREWKNDVLDLYGYNKRD